MGATQEFPSSASIVLGERVLGYDSVPKSRTVLLLYHRSLSIRCQGSPFLKDKQLVDRVP